MRVAHFVQRYPPAVGGSEAYFARLSRYLAAQGDEVVVVTTAARDLEAFWSPRGRRLRAGTTREDGVEVRRHGLWHCPLQRRVLKALSFLPLGRWRALALSCNPVAWSMWRDAGRRPERFDLVHATAFPYGWVVASGLRLARRLGVPFVVTPFVHTGDPHDPRDRTRRAYLAPALLDLLRAADRVFVQTTVERDALLERGFPSETLLLQGMGVDLDSCTGGDRAAARKAWGVTPADVVVGHLANASVEKGTVDLLRAVQRLLMRAPQRRLRVVLAGPEMPNFRTFWRSCPIKDRVTRLGILSDAAKRDFFAGIDVFAMPSRSDSFGLVFLEAWANGVPNVAYEAGGVPGVIRTGLDGLLARCGDLDGLATALERLSDDADLRRRLGGAGRERLPGEFRWEDKLARVRAAYASLAGAQ